MDSDALDRLESALSSDEAREIFGDGLQPFGTMGVNIEGTELDDETAEDDDEHAPDQSKWHLVMVWVERRGGKVFRGYSECRRL